jgi:hypothetical protein
MRYPVSTMQLHLLDQLFRQKSQQLRELAAGLQLEDAKDENRFLTIVENIKRQVLLIPVEIGEPTVLTHEEIIKNVGPSFQNPMPGKRIMYQITLTIPFTGSPELFNAKPEGVSLPIGRMYQPEGANLEVIVELPQLNREQALSGAQRELRDTRAVIEANKEPVTKWSAGMESTIEHTLANKRAEILSFYQQ